MKPIQKPEDFILVHGAVFGFPGFRVLDEITDGQSDTNLDRKEPADDLTAAADFHVQPLLSVGRGYPLLIDFRNVVECQRILKALF